MVAAAKLGKPLGVLGVALFAVDALKTRRQLGRQAIVPGSQIQVEEFFERLGVAGSADQYSFQNGDGLLCQPVTGEKVYVGE